MKEIDNLEDIQIYIKKTKEIVAWITTEGYVILNKQYDYKYSSYCDGINGKIYITNPKVLNFYKEEK